MLGPYCPPQGPDPLGNTELVKRRKKTVVNEFEKVSRTLQDAEVILLSDTESKEYESENSSYNIRGVEKGNEWKTFLNPFLVKESPVISRNEPFHVEKETEERKKQANNYTRKCSLSPSRKSSFLFSSEETTTESSNGVWNLGEKEIAFTLLPSPAPMEIHGAGTKVVAYEGVCPCHSDTGKMHIGGFSSEGRAAKADDDGSETFKNFPEEYSRQKMDQVVSQDSQTNMNIHTKEGTTQEKTLGFTLLPLREICDVPRNKKQKTGLRKSRRGRFIGKDSSYKDIGKDDCCKDGGKEDGHGDVTSEKCLDVLVNKEGYELQPLPFGNTNNSVFEAIMGAAHIRMLLWNKNIEKG